jgi:hypothetical protein
VPTVLHVSTEGDPDTIWYPNGYTLSIEPDTIGYIATTEGNELSILYRYGLSGTHATMTISIIPKESPFVVEEKLVQ